MRRFKKRSGKDKGQEPSPSAEESAYATAPSPSPSYSSSLSADPNSISQDLRRASEPISNVSGRPRRFDRLPSSPFPVSASSSFAIPTSPSQSLEHRHKDPTGLTIIYEPDTPPPLDIIFVHGLGGTSRATWAHGRDLEYFWPQRWLPFEPGIRAARILSFGYNAKFAATGPVPITGIADFAKDLLYSMKFAKDEHLEELELGQRPIIFIAHSMGGLVVKQAYILGQNDEKFSGIVSSISAILFLATPHRGSDLADILNKILAVSIFGHNPKLYVAELKSGSQTVEAINEQFRHIAPRLDILSFYETLQTSVGPKKTMVVEKSSATLGYAGEISKSLDADHHTICKFTSVQDSNYISVRNALKTLVDTIPSTEQQSLGKQEESQMEQLETLLAVSETHQDDLEFFRKRWAPGTCHWVLSNPSFKRWVDEREDGSAMLWLHALPASGKSILSSFIVNYLLRESVCLYYFFRFGAESKRSLSTCLRTIAFQAAAQLPQFRRALKDTRFTIKTLEKTDPKTIWEKVFIGVLFKMKFPTTLYWVIDALDESDHPQLLLDLMQSIPQSSTPIRALLVSRQTPDLISTFERLSIIVPVVYLPLEETKKDIRTYVEKEVQFFHASAEFKGNIVEKLVAGAIGNFLWASLALVEVGRCNTQEDLDETLEGIPSGMEQLYQRMESTIIDNNKRPRDQKLGQMILTWAACSRRPLVLKELEQALQPEFDVKIDLKFTISRVCGQFVIVDDTDQLVMVHQTARDHITTTKSPLGVDVEEGHEKIFAKCLSVLEEKHQRRELDRRGTNQKATENQEFLRYATTDWAYHLNMTSPRSDAPLSLLTKFLKGNSVLGWIASLAQENQLKVLVYSSKHLNLYVRRKSGRYVATNPLLHRLRDLDLLESWATDFLKILGKFGRNLSASPASIYEQIPPFCPKHSQIYTLFKQQAPVPHPVAVEGVSNHVWDDSLAKLSLGPGSRALAVLCSGDHFAVLTSSGAIVLYKSVTFEIRRTLTHGEQVCAMSFSTCSNMFVTYGFRTTKVWHVKTGRIKYQIRNPMGSRAFTIAFSASCTQLIIGSNDRLIRIARLTDANPAWSLLHPDLLKADTVLDRPVHNVPWRIAFNCDSNYVAVSYRGAPLCVWALDPPELIGRCMRNQEYAGNSWTVVDQVIWHAKSEEVLGLYLGGHVFRWNPFNNTQQELQAAASILASSPEGKFFAIGDCNGTIKLYNFHHFALIYQLSCEGMMDDICFSPDSKRLYDVRGQFCNIWEPNALLRVDEAGEQDNEAGSETASVPTCSVSESFSEMRDQITAVAIQFRGRYHAIGNAIGLVSVVDSLEDDHVGIELWRSPVSLSIEHLSWSCDGTHLACAELTGKVVVKSVLLENDQKWTVLPTFGVKLKVSSEGIRQVLLNQNGKALLVKNGPSVTVWSQTEQSSELKQISLESSDAKWFKHPTDSKLLLAFSPFSLQVYLWDDLSEVALFNLDRPQFGPSLDICRTSDYTEHPSSAFRINSVFTNPAGSHFLMDTVVDTCTGEEHLASLFEGPAGSSLTPSAGKRPSSTITEISIPAEIQDQVEIPLGILPVKRLIFLDKDYWVCSWRLGGNLTTEKIQKYYFLPKDWLNVDCLDLCALLADGRFLIPHNGELAVIKSTWMSHW